MGAAAPSLPGRRQLRRVPDLLPLPLGLAGQRRGRSAWSSRDERAGGAVRPAAGRGVPAAELRLARGRHRRPSRGARREPADLARRQLRFPGSPRAGVGAVASGRAPRPVPGDLPRHGPEPRLGADAAVPEPHAPSLPRRQPGTGDRVRRAPRRALLLAHAHVRERRRCPARLPDLLQRPRASPRRAFPCLARGARPRRTRVRRARGDAAVAVLRGLRGARRARTAADLPRRSPQALLPLELRDGGRAGAALRASARTPRARARDGAGRVEPGADDGGRAHGLRALLRRLPGGRRFRLAVAPRRSGADLGRVAARRDGVPRGQPSLALGQPSVPVRDPHAVSALDPRCPGAAPRPASARRAPEPLARRRVPLRRRRLRDGPLGVGALSRRGAGARLVPGERAPRDGPRGRARPARCWLPRSCPPILAASCSRRC